MGLPGATRRAPWRRCQPPQWADEGFQELHGEAGLGEAMYPKTDHEGSPYTVCGAGGVGGGLGWSLSASGFGEGEVQGQCSWGPQGRACRDARGQAGIIPF